MFSSTKFILNLVTCFILSTAHPISNPKVVNMKEILFQQSKPFTLSCPIKSASSLEYSWQKDGVPFDYSSLSATELADTLVFLSPKTEDGGKYQCFAKSTEGIASSGIINVKRTYISIPKLNTVKLTPIEGKPFKLECLIPEGYPKPKISWMYQQAIDPSISHTILDKRITQAPDGALYFANITKEDTSKNFKYVCLAKSPAVEEPVPLVEYFIEDLKENKENNAELVPQYLSSDMVAKAGDVTMIYCIYGGTPLAHPDWFFEGKNVNGQPNDRVTRHNRSAGKRLLIRDTYLSDQGTYTCEANNEVGKPQKHSIRLTVVSAPQFSKKPETRSIATIGQDITIPCQVKGVPAPKITWTYNAKPLTTNERISINTAGVGKDVTVADVVIKSVQKSDAGYYGCKAVNEHGEEYEEGLLSIA